MASFNSGPTTTCMRRPATAPTRGSAWERPEPSDSVREDPPDRSGGVRAPATTRSLQAIRSWAQRDAPTAGRDLELRPAKSMALLVRPPDGGADYRRRRAEQLGGSQYEPIPGGGRGDNFGWNCREGAHDAPRPEDPEASPSPCAPPGSGPSPNPSLSIRIPMNRTGARS